MNDSSNEISLEGVACIHATLMCEHNNDTNEWKMLLKNLRGSTANKFFGTGCLTKNKIDLEFIIHHNYIKTTCSNIISFILDVISSSSENKFIEFQTAIVNSDNLILTRTTMKIIYDNTNLYTYSVIFKNFITMDQRRSLRNCRTRTSFLVPVNRIIENRNGINIKKESVRKLEPIDIENKQPTYIDICKSICYKVNDLRRKYKNKIFTINIQSSCFISKNDENVLYSFIDSRINNTLMFKYLTINCSVFKRNISILLYFNSKFEDFENACIDQFTLKGIELPEEYKEFNVTNINKLVNSAKKVILIADDSLLNIKILNRYLIKHLKLRNTTNIFRDFDASQWGSNRKFIIDFTEDYGLIYVSNGSVAFEFIEMFNIDVLITDIEMPIVNGIELLEMIDKNNYQMKKSIHTTLLVDEMSKIFPHFDFSMCEIIHKGSSESIMKSFLENLLESH